MSHPYQPDQPQQPQQPGPSGHQPSPGQPSQWGQQPDPGQYGQQPDQSPGQGQWNQPPSSGQYGQPAAAGQWGQQPNSGQQPTPGPWAQQPGQGQYGQQPDSGQQPTSGPWAQQPTSGPWAQQPGQGQYGQQPNSGPYGQHSADPYGQPIQAGWAPTGPGQPPKGGRRRGMLAAAVAVVVVAGGGISYVAFRDQNGGGGAGTPKAAVGTLVSALSKSDLLGVLDSLPPAERASLHDSFVAQVGQFKRLKVLQKSADANKVSGVTFKATGLTYASSPAVVNNHVQLVTVTAGTILLNSDTSKVPYTKEFLDAAFDGKAPNQTSDETVDIAAQTRKTGKPLRIAVQKVNGKWYPSLMYTAVAASVDSTPSATDAIAGVGAGTADDAVRGVVTAVAKQDYRGLIGRLDPNEDAALHDYGSLLLHNAPSSSNSSVSLSNITLTDTAVAGGTRVSLKSVQFSQDGKTTTITIDGQCAVVASGGDSKRMCASEALDQYGSSLHLSASEKAALTDLFAAIPKIGVVATKSGGQWFVSPIRTYADLDVSILSNLKDNDLLTLIKLARRQ
jgi:hypothetical protein